jgi:hypothetical protein
MRPATVLSIMTEGAPAPFVPPIGPAVSPPPPPPSRTGVSRKAGLTAVLAVAVVFLLLLSLVFFGGDSGSSNGGAVAVSFSSARGTAANGSPPGSWDLVVAEGLNLANATTLMTNLTSVKNCTVTSFSGGIPSSISIPSFQGNLASGVATDWVFAYVQPSTGAELEILVSNGLANPVIELSGTACAVSLNTFRAIPSDVVDSPAAAAAVAAAGGGAFLSAHPTGVSEEMALVNPNIPGDDFGSEWGFLYTTCPLETNGTISTVSGSMFMAAVNATSGMVIPGSASSTTCGGPIGGPPPNSIGFALQFQGVNLTRGAGTGGTLASQGCTSGDYCYELPIAAASENVTPGDFEAQVINTTNGTESGVPVVGYAITNAAGQVVVYESGSVEAQWTPGVGNSSTLLTSTMTLWVDMGVANPSGGFMILQLTGTGPFADSAEGISLSGSLI